MRVAPVAPRDLAAARSGQDARFSAWRELPEEPREVGGRGGDPCRRRHVVCCVVARDDEATAIGAASRVPVGEGARGRRIEVGRCFRQAGWRDDMMTYQLAMGFAGSLFDDF